jgi:hypothetical protein
MPSWARRYFVLAANDPGRILVAVRFFLEQGSRFELPEHLKVNPFHATAGAARYGVSLPRKHPQ